MKGKIVLLSLMGLSMMGSVSAFAADKIQGMITTRTGETLIVNSGNGNTTVVLTDSTVTKDDKGLFGLDKEHMSSAVLIPGLKVKVEGSSDGNGRFVAKTITVDGDDLETAEMIQAGLHPTAEQVDANVQAIAKLQKHTGMNQQDIASTQKGVAANQSNIASNQQQIQQNMKDIESNTDRWNALSEFDVKGQTTLKFNVGSAKIAPADMEELKKLGQTATGLKGYIIEVVGYADSTGSAAMNTKLSEDRAKAVVTYLFQQCNVPVRHIVAPGAMGEYGPAAPNETKAGRAENRRVDVKILVNKGIAGT
jgi:outer membrane protein OmpA-like peptidoglycan-associated protein